MWLTMCRPHTSVAQRDAIIAVDVGTVVGGSTSEDHVSSSMKKVCRRAGALAMATAVVAVVLSSGSGHRSSAGAETAGSALGSFALTATAPGFEATEDEPGAQTHPEGQGSVPETSTTLSTGPVGYALSTVFWPGPLAGNAG